METQKKTKMEAKCIVQFILLDERDACTKQKILNVFRQKHQVVHDHYSFESLKKTESSIVVALCCLPLGLQLRPCL